MRVTVLVAFDVLDPKFNPDAVKTFIDRSRDIDGWWNHIPGVYVLNLNADWQQVVDDLISIQRGAFFLMTPINPKNTNGFLPQAAWDWLNRAGEPKAPAPPAPQLGIGGHPLPLPPKKS